VNARRSPRSGKIDRHAFERFPAADTIGANHVVNRFVIAESGNPISLVESSIAVGDQTSFPSPYA